MRESVAGWRALPMLLVAAMTVVGVALRLAVADQSVFGDELSTYWIVSTNGLGDVVSTVHTDAEITPPLSFVLAWLTTRIDLTPELLRAPSLVAGAATIPLTYLLGQRTVGRGAALVAASLTALSPFMIFYSAEARGYALMVALLLGSTLALLAAVDDRRARWWVVYAACSCAAMYTHYTAVFVLAGQLLWVLWAHPDARKPALLANVGATVGFLPWVSGLMADFDSPTTDILSALSRFDLYSVRISLEHWSVGYPYVQTNTGLRELPGLPALVMLALGVAAGVAGLAVTALRRPLGYWRAHLDRRVILVVVLGLSVPIGEALVSAVGTNLFGVRNLAASWPGFALCLAAVLVAAGPRLRFAAVALAIGAFAIAAAKMLDEDFRRPDFQAVAGFLDRNAAPGDVVIDGALFGISPGPLGGLDVALDRPHRVIRAGAAQQRDHPFSASDRVLSPVQVSRRAVAAAGGNRIFVLLPLTGTGLATGAPAKAMIRALPSGYRRVDTRTFPGILTFAVFVYADRASP